MTERTRNRLEELKAMNLTELLMCRVDAVWKLSQIEAQMAVRTGEEHAVWQRTAKSALKHTQAEVAAMNNLLQLRRSEIEGNESVNFLQLMSKVAYLFDAARIHITEETNESFELLQRAVSEIEEYEWVIHR